MLCPDVFARRCAGVVRGETSRLTLGFDRFLEPFGLPRGFLDTSVATVVAHALRGTVRFTTRTVFRGRPRGCFSTGRASLGCAPAPSGGSHVTGTPVSSLDDCVFSTSSTSLPDSSLPSSLYGLRWETCRISSLASFSSVALTVLEPVSSMIFSGPAYFGANFADIPCAAEERTQFLFIKRSPTS